MDKSSKPSDEVKEQPLRENRFPMCKNVCEILFYPIERFLQITKIRMDAHIYIEVKLPFFSMSIKLCITTIWIILYMIHCYMRW